MKGDRHPSFSSPISSAPNLDRLLNWHRSVSSPRVTSCLHFQKFSWISTENGEKLITTFFNENATRMKRLLKCNKTSRNDHKTDRYKATSWNRKRAKRNTCWKAIKIHTKLKIEFLTNKEHRKNMRHVIYLCFCFGEFCNCIYTMHMSAKKNSEIREWLHSHALSCNFVSRKHIEFHVLKNISHFSSFNFSNSSIDKTSCATWIRIGLSQKVNAHVIQIIIWWR